MNTSAWAEPLSHKAINAATRRQDQIVNYEATPCPRRVRSAHQSQLQLQLHSPILQVPLPPRSDHRYNRKIANN